MIVWREKRLLVVKKKKGNYHLNPLNVTFLRLSAHCLGSSHSSRCLLLTLIGSWLKKSLCALVADLCFKPISVFWETTGRRDVGVRRCCSRISHIRRVYPTKIRTKNSTESLSWWKLCFHSSPVRVGFVSWQPEPLTLISSRTRRVEIILQK